MDFEQVIGLLAAVLITGANIPQTIKIIRTRSTKSLSAATYAMLLLGGICWVVYGVLRNDIPIILANAISSLLCGTILFIKLLEKYRKKKVS